MAFEVFTLAEQAISKEIVRFAVYPISILSAGVVMLIIPLLTMWFSYRIYLIMTGVIAESFNHIVKDFAVKGSILGLAGSLGLLYSHLVYPLMETQDAMAQDFSSNGTASIFNNIEGHIGQLGDLLEASMGVGEMTSHVEQDTQANGGEPLGFFGWMWDSIKDAGTRVATASDNLGGIWELAMLAIKIAIVMAGLIIMGVFCFITVMLNKIFFMLGLGFAPLFITFLAFDATRGWFVSWLSSTLGYCLSYPLAMMTVSILLQIYAGIYDQKTLTFGIAAACFTTSLVFTVIINKIGNAASAWFGSSGMGESAALGVASFVGDVKNYTKKGGKLIGKGIGKAASSTGHVTRDSAVGAYKWVNGFRVPTKITKE